MHSPTISANQRAALATRIGAAGALSGFVNEINAINQKQRPTRSKTIAGVITAAEKLQRMLEIRRPPAAVGAEVVESFPCRGGDLPCS
jgi:hypothetical protein